MKKTKIGDIKIRIKPTVVAYTPPTEDELYPETSSSQLRKPLHEILGANAAEDVAIENGNTAQITDFGYQLLSQQATHSKDVIGGIIAYDDFVDQVYYINQHDRIVDITTPVKSPRTLWITHVGVAGSDFTSMNTNQLKQHETLLKEGASRNNNEGLFSTLHDCVRAELNVRSYQEERDRINRIFDEQVRYPKDIISPLRLDRSGLPVIRTALQATSSPHP